MLTVPLVPTQPVQEPFPYCRVFPAPQGPHPTQVLLRALFAMQDILRLLFFRIHHPIHLFSMALLLALRVLMVRTLTATKPRLVRCVLLERTTPQWVQLLLLPA